MEWYEIKIDTPLPILESLYNFLWPFVNGLTIKKTDKDFIVKVFIFSSSADQIFKKLEKFLRIQAKSLKLQYPATSLNYASPNNYNDFVIVPVPAPYVPPFGIPIFIQRGRAFGTGSHPCTIYCLEALKKITEMSPEDFTKAKILDAGVGTGILSIAATKLGASNVIGVDIDAEFIEEAKGNILLNSVDNAIQLFHCSVEDVSGKFNIIFANLYGSLLKKISYSLAQRLFSNGLLVIGGMNILQSSTVVSSFEAYGLKKFRHYSDEEWYVAILKKV